MQRTLVLGFLIVSSLPTGAQAFRLSARVVEQLPLPVRTAKLAGSRVVFKRDLSPTSTAGMYSVPIDGSEAPLALFSSALLLPGEGYAVSPDGAWVAALESRGSNRFAIVSTPVDRYAPITLNDNLGNPVALEFSPDSRHVVFFGVSGYFWSVPVGGGAVVSFSRSSFDNHHYTADGSLVVYLGVDQLASRPVDGSAPETVLWSATVHDGNTSISPVSTGGRIALGTGRNIWSVPVDGSSARILLSTTHQGRVLLEGERLTLAGERVLYFADPAASGERRLFSVPLDGSAAPVELGRSLPVLHEALELSPDRSRVLFRSDMNSAGAFELFVVPVDGSSVAIRLANASGRAVVSADGTRAVFDAEGFDPALFDSLNVVPLDGSSAAVPLVPPSSHPVTFQNLRFTPDGTRLLYMGDDGVEWRDEVSIVALDAASPPVRLSGGRVGDIDWVHMIELSGDRVVMAPGNQRGVYMRPLDASQPIIDLTEDLGTARIVSATRHITRGPWSAYLDERGILASATIGEHHRMNPPLAEETAVQEMQISPGLSHVVYRDGTSRLMSTPLRGGPTTRLSPFSHLVDSWRFAGQEVLFVGQDSGVGRLFRVPLNGSAPAEEIQTAGTPSEVITLSPNSRFVLVRQNRAEVARIDLSGALQPETLATDYTEQGSVTSDSTRFLYLSGGLRSVPMDGSTSSTLLAGDGSTAIRSYLLSPNSQLAAFVYIILAHGDRGVGFVPADGSSAAILFPPSDCWEVIGFSPGGLGLLYSSWNGNSNNIYLQPLSAGSPAKKLLGPYSNGTIHYNGGSHVLVELPGSILAVAIDGSGVRTLPNFVPDAGAALSPDGTRVAFSSQGNLYWSPIDFSRPAKRLNDRGIPGATFRDLTFTLGSKALTFRATLQEPGVFDLYGAFLEPIEHTRKSE